ncbi:hypothetical protein TEA_008607 [Camellia sinensis var. sinensis]|uniref:Uncharacterized protein n=1 Tax=Camellia sinensis var. sinensis TaxID=542762 RepID=A0A4S4EAM7_CAMSN|nr:hypothetical protein TEA_008607 [Camellia sinensis var. sinensis]
MDCPIPACAKCTLNCLLIHGKNKDPSIVATSFFKIMIGDNFSKVLFLPPKFAQTVSDLIDQKTQLEDESGQRWTTTSSVDGTKEVMVEDVRPLSHVNTMPQSQAEAEIVDKLPVTEEVVSQTTLSDVPNLPILEKNKEFQMIDNVSNQDSGS